MTNSYDVSKPKQMLKVSQKIALCIYMLNEGHEGKLNVNIYESPLF